jgi:hypothetical protein
MLGAIVGEIWVHGFSSCLSLMMRVVREGDRREEREKELSVHKLSQMPQSFKLHWSPGLVNVFST